MMKKVAITNMLIFIFTLFTLFAFEAHLEATIGLSVDSEGQPAKLDRGFFEVTVTNPYKDVKIVNYPVLVVLAGLAVNLVFYWQSRKFN